MSWHFTHTHTHTHTLTHTQGTVSADKNELLFSQFGINYNNLPEIYRKGSVLIWTPSDKASTSDQKHEKAEDSDKTTDKSQHSIVIEKANFTDDSRSHDSSGNSSSKSCNSTPAAATAIVVSLGTANDRGSRRSKGKVKRVVEVLHVDIIGDKFWTEHADILRGE